MQLAATQFSFDQPHISQVFKIARQVGFDAIELVPSTDPSGPCPLTVDKEKVKAIREEANKNHRAIETIMGSFWEPTLCDPRPGGVEKCIEQAILTIEMTGALGATDLLVIPGAVEIPWKKGYPPVPYEHCWD